MSEPNPWTPEEVRIVASAIYGSSWQTPLAFAIARHSRVQFPQSRIAKWYLEQGGRGIPEWLRTELTPILRKALAEAEEAHRRASEIIDSHSGDQS